MKKTALLTIVLLTAVWASATKVDYQFSYVVGNGLVNGELVTVDQGDGSYLVTGATGSYLGSAITGVFDPSLSGNTFSFNNLLYFPSVPAVDLGGIVFQLNGDANIATGINLYWDGEGYRSIDGGNNGPYVQLSLDPLAPLAPQAPTPEPGTLALLASGVVGGAGILRRKVGQTASGN
ncbi:MAG: PEP-CTERM sorting domain-containing protein [Candidatus Korobacteraceae bacterium]